MDNNAAGTYVHSRKIPLVILGATAIVCSRALFFFFRDSEGPNLVVVAGMALVLYFLSLAVYLFKPLTLTGPKIISAGICIQLLAAVVIYFCMR